MVYYTTMNKILDLCPTLKNMTHREQLDAVVRMCVAHVLNGGAYVGVYATAKAYLERMKDET